MRGTPEPRLLTFTVLRGIPVIADQGTDDRANPRPKGAPQTEQLPHLGLAAGRIGNRQSNEGPEHRPRQQPSYRQLDNRIPSLHSSP